MVMVIYVGKIVIQNNKSKAIDNKKGLTGL